MSTSEYITENVDIVFTVKDEFHMLLICPLNSNLRTEFFPQRWLCRQICYQLFYNIMSTQNNNEILCLSKCIYRVFLLEWYSLNINISIVLLR